MNTEPATNSVAALLKLTRPINFSPLGIATTAQPLFANNNFQRAAFTTGFIGTGLALSALYSGVLKGGRHASIANNTLPAVRWLGGKNLSIHMVLSAHITV
jgi:hypothetical protein